MSEITEQNVVLEVLPPAPDARALNAIKHGLGTEHVPLSEREAYTAHVLEVRESLGAVGYLQERLANRAALLMWRLERVARYEAAQSSSNQYELLGHVENGQPYGKAGQVIAMYEYVGALTGEKPAKLRARPEIAEHRAQTLERYAQTFDAWAEGGVAGAVDENAAIALGQPLGKCLLRAWASVCSALRSKARRWCRPCWAAL